jgi:hypothetical protein
MISNPAVTGTISGANIAVTVPYNTPLTNLVPLITHTGASIDPPSGAAQDFTGPVTYTVTAEDGTTAVYTVRVSPEPPPPADITITEANIGDLAALLAAVQGKGNTSTKPLGIAVNLALTSANWNAILTALDSTGKYINLDLSACTGGVHSSGGGLYADKTFDPDNTVSTGKSRIVSLVLPNGAESTAAGYSSIYSAFRYFTGIKSVSGAGIITIGEYAFADCDALAAASFPAATDIGGFAFGECNALTTISVPAATDIGDNAFYYCRYLTTINLPAATSIGNWAFRKCSRLSTASLPAAASIGAYAFEGCTALTTVSLPAAASIGEYAFGDCAALATASFPAATVIDGHAFEDCSALETVNLPVATVIGWSAFYGCRALTTVSLPAATAIDSYAFSSCTALETVSLPAATFIGNAAFSYTGTGSLTLTLGSTPPTLGTAIFSGVTAAKTVTVKVPSAALSAYGPSPTDTTTNNWGNAFRGKGWSSAGGYDTGTVNAAITLAIQAAP